MFVLIICLFLSSYKTSENSTFFMKFCNISKIQYLPCQEIDAKAFKYHKNYLHYNILKLLKTKNIDDCSYFLLYYSKTMLPADKYSNRTIRRQKITKALKIYYAKLFAGNYNSADENFKYFWNKKIPLSTLLKESMPYNHIILELRKDPDVARENQQIYNIIVFFCEEMKNNIVYDLIIRICEFINLNNLSIEESFTREYCQMLKRFIRIFWDENSIQNENLKLEDTQMPYLLENVKCVLQEIKKSLFKDNFNQNRPYKHLYNDLKKEHILIYITENENKCVVCLFDLYLESQNGCFYSSCFILSEIYTILKSKIINDQIIEYIRKGIILKFKEVYIASLAGKVDIRKKFICLLSNCTCFVKRYNEYFKELLIFIFDIHPKNMKFKPCMHVFYKFSGINLIDLQSKQILFESEKLELFCEYLAGYQFN